MQWRRVLLVGAAVSLTATAALAILILLFGDFGETEGRILSTTLTISAFSLLALPGVMLLERDRARALGGANVGAAALAFALTQVLIWGAEDDETMFRVAGTVVSVAVFLTQTAALALWRRSDDPAPVRATSVAATVTLAVVAAMVVGAIWAEPDADWYPRTLAALAVLDVLLVALQPLLRRLVAAPTEAQRVVLEGTPEQIAEALRRLEGTGVSVRR